MILLRIKPDANLLSFKNEQHNEKHVSILVFLWIGLLTANISTFCGKIFVLMNVLICLIDIRNIECDQILCPAKLSTLLKTCMRTENLQQKIICWKYGL